MARFIRLEVADIYIDKKARDAADLVIEALDDSLPMLEYIRQWELAYMDAGGKIKPPTKGRIR